MDNDLAHFFTCLRSFIWRENWNCTVASHPPAFCEKQQKVLFQFLISGLHGIHGTLNSWHCLFTVPQEVPLCWKMVIVGVHCSRELVIFPVEAYLLSVGSKIQVTSKGGDVLMQMNVNLTT